jgi:hypothetical protein
MPQRAVLLTILQKQRILCENERVMQHAILLELTRYHHTKAEG